ncbi:hypothetical protein TNCV_873301 [Trichonephila clavipes]|nr:hypothetical protein TNCV_873301 [Trichonephila clavipes]
MSVAGRLMKLLSISIKASASDGTERVRCFRSEGPVWQGLAPDSATSSGLRRAPHSAMQDPIQAPPGTTRQAGLYTS